jgi:hypothetical protein
MSTVRNAALVSVLGIGCFVAGLAVGRKEQPVHVKPTTAEPTPAPAAVTCGVSIDPLLLRAELARALATAAPALATTQRQENAATPVTGTVAPSAPDPDPGPTPEQVAAFDRGQALFDQTLREGRMTEARSAELRTALAGMDESSRIETTRKLIQAMNQDKIRSDTHDLPF